MLADISITNLGVIVSASAELAEGLTVLTGETGAGKTMVVSGLRLLSGARADASRVRSGAQQASVEGRFSVDKLDPTSAANLRALTEDIGVTTDENGEYIAARTVSAKGRSRAYLGGRGVPAGTLADATAHLLTIHGQNDQLRLTSPDEQLAALDRFDPKIADVHARYLKNFKRWRSLAKDLKERTEKKRELAQEVDRLTFALNEIDAVAPEPNEDVEIVETIRRLQDVDALREAASTALAAIDGSGAAGGSYDDDGEAASTQLGQAAQALSQSQDKVLREQGAILEEMTSQLAEISGVLGRFLADLPADAQALDSLLQRQADLKNLTRKYAADITGVLAWREEAAARLAKIDTSTEAIEELTKEVRAAQEDVTASGAELTQVRTQAALRLGEAVTAELHGLAMPKARLEVAVEKAPYSRTGADAVEFRLAPNDALPAAPLASSASGGELSRVMLALEVILSTGLRGTTMVFDEVDAGVGGRAAVEIGRRLARLATHNQVIVVTHLPQVAAYADTHLHVAKEVGDATVTSGVRALSESERVEELARMLAGLDDTDTGRAHAQELLQRAQAEVAQFRA